MVRASVIMTVLNEQGTIGRTLSKVFDQLPHGCEVVVVDAGSSDGTPGVLRSIAEQGLPLRWLVELGCTRGSGRNRAIIECSNAVIVSIDGGCEPLDGWYQALTDPFSEPDAPDVVGGYWLPTARSIYGVALSGYTTPRPESISNREFLPSSRCIAFRKEAWKAVGGYPDENLGEDTSFDIMLRQKGFRFRFVPRALVTWAQRETLKGTCRQFFSYGVGSAKLGLLGVRFPLKIAIIVCLLTLCLSSRAMAGACAFAIVAVTFFEARRKSRSQPVVGMVVGIVVRASTLAGEAYGLVRRVLAPRAA